MNVPDDMSVYDSLMNEVFRPESADSVVSAASLRGVNYEMNLAATIVFESIIANESVDTIKMKFGNIFSEIDDSVLDNEIEEIISNFLLKGLIEDCG